MAPLADGCAAGLLEDADTPDYLRAAAYMPAVQAWARAEAIAALLWDYLAERDIEAALTERIEGTETEDRGEGGSVRRTSVSRRVMSVLDQLHKHESRALHLRSKLGLDPLSRARIMRDLGIAHQAGGEAIARMAETGRAIREKRDAELRLVNGGSDNAA